MDRRTSTVFLDCLFNLLLGFSALLFVALINMNPPVKKEDVPKSTNLMITIEWNPQSANDVDMWLLPLETKDPIYFRNRSNSFIHLDRDDIGKLSDTIEARDGTQIVVPVNREVMVFRSIVDGDYALNIHLYLRREQDPEKVRVIVATVDPAYSILHEDDYILSRHGEELIVGTISIRNKIISFGRDGIKYVDHFITNSLGGTR